MSRYLRAGSLVALSAILALLLGEMVLRGIGFEEPVLYQPDPVLGFTLRPGARAVWKREGYAHIEINGHGFRDRERTAVKPRDVFRIAVLGDSYVEALQVPLEQTFGYVLEQLLGDCKVRERKRFEVMNFGVSGYGTAQELLLYRHKVREFSPDLVLLAFTSGNDVRNNTRMLEADSLRPYFIYQEGQLREDRSFVDTRLYRVARTVSPLIAQSRLLQLANKVRIQLKQDARERQMRGHVSLDAGIELGLDAEVYRETKEPVWEEAWKVTEGLLEMFAAETRHDGVVLVIATLSNSIQVNPDSSARKAYAEALGVRDLFYPDRRISRVAERLGVPAIMLAPRLAELAQANGVYLHGFPNTAPGVGHWNEAGHRAAARVLSEFLCRPGLISSQSVR